MNSRDYWAKREAEALKHYITDEKEYDKRIKQIYSDMLDACQKEINGFYGKYAAKEGITIAEAKKRVKQADIAAYERKAKRYVREKDFSDKANEEMRLYNATMKINRLEMLKANIGLELIDGHEQLDKFMSDILKGRTEDELKRQAGILGKTVKSNAKKVDAIVNGSFKVAKVGSKSTFSDYIWQYQDLMREELGKILQTGLIRGKNPRAIAKDLRKYWYGADPKTNGGAVYCMERLMRTELARVQTEAQKQSFERNGFDQYIFIVNGGCCPICEALKDKPFPVAKMMPGENAPPMHPNCRCSVAAYSDRKEYEEWLQHLANGGTTEEWEAMKKAGQKIDIDALAQKDNPTTLGKDEEKLIASGKYDIKTSGGYADREKQYISLENLEIKQKVAEMAGAMPANNGKFTKKYISESIEYQQRLKEASLKAAQEYAKEIEKVSSEGAKILLAKQTKKWADNASEADKMIDWLKKKGGITDTPAAKNKNLTNSGNSGTLKVEIQLFAKKTQHGADRAAFRSVTDAEIDNAIESPLHKGQEMVDSYGRKSIKYIGEQATVILNPDNGEVITTWKTGSRVRKKYGKDD